MTLLDRDTLLTAAREATGLDNFGDSGFIEALDRLLACLHEEASLNASGRLMLHHQYLQLLSNRLRLEHDLSRHPEILDEPLLPPIVVLGLPRSGTTKFHRVLAAHPDTQYLPLWQLMNPAPFPDTDNTGEDPRIGFARDALTLLASTAPDTLAGHPMAAEEAEEESQYLMEMTFDGPLVPVRAHLPGYSAWRWRRSMLPCYRYLKTLLQYLQWQNGEAGKKTRPFVLKNPLHLGHIDTLLRVFPGATVVHCHRDPVDSVPSFARLVEVGWAMVCDIDDRALFGSTATALLHTHISRYLELRPALEANANFIDIPFQAIVDDAHACAALCCQQHGLAYDEQVRQRIRAWEEANPAPAHGQHSYSLARYGLSEPELRARFSEYYKFGVNRDSRECG